MKSRRSDHRWQVVIVRKTDGGAGDGATAVTRSELLKLSYGW